MWRLSGYLWFPTECHRLWRWWRVHYFQFLLCKFWKCYSKVTIGWDPREFKEIWCCWEILQKDSSSRSNKIVLPISLLLGVVLFHKKFALLFLCILSVISLTTPLSTHTSILRLQLTAELNPSNPKFVYGVCYSPWHSSEFFCWKFIEGEEHLAICSETPPVKIVLVLLGCSIFWKIFVRAFSILYIFSLFFRIFSSDLGSVQGTKMRD